MGIGVVGVIMGIILGLTGASSGILAVPLVVLFLHLSIPQAVPMALLAVAVSAAIGALLDVRHGKVNIRTALLLGSIGTCTAPLGEIAAHYVNENVLNIVFGALLLFVCFRSIAASRPVGYTLAPVNDTPDPDEDPGRVDWSFSRASVMVLTGSVAGVLSGVLGVGGAFVIGPALRRHSSLSPGAIGATTLAVVAIIASAAAIVSISTHQMNLSTALPFCGWAIVGMSSGRLVCKFLGAHHFQKYLGILFFLAAIGMASRGFV